MNEKETLLKNSTLLLEGLTILGIPLCFTQQYTKGLGETLGSLSSLVPGFSPIEKTDFSCYATEQYLNFLDIHKSKIIIICGIEAGYFPVVISDSIASRTDISKTAALERFRFENIMTSTSESILFELTRSSRAEAFRAISKLVK